MRNFQICFCIFVTIGIILYLVFGIYEKDRHPDKGEERFEYFLGSKKQFITAMSIDLACSFSFFTVLILCLRWYKYGNKGKGEPQSFTMDQKFIWILAGLALFTFIAIASNLYVVLQQTISNEWHFFYLLPTLFLYELSDCFIQCTFLYVWNDFVKYFIKKLD